MKRGYSKRGKVWSKRRINEANTLENFYELKQELQTNNTFRSTRSKL